MVFPFLVLPTKHLFSIRVRSAVGFLFLCVSAQNWCTCLWSCLAFGKDHQIRCWFSRRPMAKIKIYNRLRMVKVIFLPGIMIEWVRGICWISYCVIWRVELVPRRQGRRRLDVSKGGFGRDCLVSECQLHEIDVELFLRLEQCCIAAREIWVPKSEYYLECTLQCLYSTWILP